MRQGNPLSVLRRISLAAAGLMIAAMVAAPGVAAAELVPDTFPRWRATPPPAGNPDFLFRAPRGSIGVRGGVTFNRAGGDVFGMVTEMLTLDPEDFRAASVAADLSVRIAPRLDAAFGIGFSQVTRRSEYRDLLGDDDLPIAQRTRFSQVPLTVGLKAYLTAPGRSVGRFAWIPAPVAPYIGGGAGLIHYRFEQDGEWVDYETFDIYRDLIVASGWAPAAQVFGGVEFRLGPRLVLATDARYTWASGDPGRQFRGFEGLDLSGLQTTIGLAWRY